MDIKNSEKEGWTQCLLEEDAGAAGTTLPALNAGFLCVISLLSTFRRPLVTSSPRLSSAKTAAAPPGVGPGSVAEGGGGGGGGGGGPLLP